MNKLAKRSISFVTAMFLSIMSMVTGISESLAANPVSNVSGTKETDDVTLLVGNDMTNPLRADSVVNTIKNYEKEYALGIASQFSVFVKDDFVPKNSDTEGRIAVGGNFNFKNANNDWRYSAGRGDFEHIKNLKDTLGVENTGYANVIWNGTEDKVFYGINITGECYMRDNKVTDDNWVMAVQNDAGIEYIKSDAGSPFESADKKYSNNLSRVYQEKLIDFDDAFKLLNERSEKLSKKESQFEVSEGEYDGHKAVILEYTGNSSVDTETVYCTLTGEDLEKYQNASYVVFKNIPNLPEPRTVHEADGNDEVWEYSYIVVNIPETGEVISSNNEVDEGHKYTIINDKDISAHGFANGNNKAGVTSLLYNIPNADKVTLNGAFQGTIFANNATLGDDESAPHLSELVFIAV